MSHQLNITIVSNNDQETDIKSIAKRPTSAQELNANNTSDTGSSSESPNNSCYSHGNLGKSLFTIEDTLESTKKSISANLATTISLKKQPISSSPQQPKKALARKSEFLEDEMFNKVEKKVKGNESTSNIQIHEVLSFPTNDGSKEFVFNCFPERFLGIPAEFHDKNIHHHSDNDAASSDETIVSACSHNLRKIKLELMDISPSFRYSHHHVDQEKVTAQYASPQKN